MNEIRARLLNSICDQIFKKFIYAAQATTAFFESNFNSIFSYSLLEFVTSFFFEKIG